VGTIEGGIRDREIRDDWWGIKVLFFAFSAERLLEGEAQWKLFFFPLDTGSQHGSNKPYSKIAPLQIKGGAHKWHSAGWGRRNSERW